MQPPQPILVVNLFPEILDALLSLLGDLSADAWQRPTACPGWSVKDVALHLLGVEVGNLSRRRDGQAVAGPITSWEELVTFVNDFNEAWVQAARRMSPRLVIDVLQCTGLQMCAFFRSLSPYAIGDSVSWVGPEPAPIWLDLAREYTERWVHQQQMRDAVGKPGLAWRLYEGAADRRDAEVLVDEEIAWRLCTRGLSQEQAREQVTFIGDQSLAAKVFEMVSIIA